MRALMAGADMDALAHWPASMFRDGQASNLLDHLHAGELATVEQAILTRDGQVRIADVVLLTAAQKRWLIR